ncbi:hypothetical protein COU80_02350 [Candidatus Peregrinibacteria bacterium CG10_big_fil_rev_8_21_14_0_10_55_24]|nr:MAG: hypothetical protein COU80_02350 [Candidatus Peregrinibacteria bacterium CG10_big_fil_rev_8_21_14_0_10_55_24]
MITRTFASNGVYLSEQRLLRLKENTEELSAMGSGPKYNITRALDPSDFANANLADPFNWLAKAGDIGHAVVFKPGSDLLKLVRGDREPMEPLGGIQRTKESTIGAVGNVLKGAGNILRLRPLRGGAQIGQGVLDALDVAPSFAADVLRGASTLDSRAHLANPIVESRSKARTLLN